MINIHLKLHHNLWYLHTKYSFLFEVTQWHFFHGTDLSWHTDDPGRSKGDTCSYSPSRSQSALLASCTCCLSGISDLSGFAGCFPEYPSLDQKLAAFGTGLPFVVAFSHTGGKIPCHQRTTDGRQNRKFNRNPNWKESPSISIYFS